MGRTTSLGSETYSLLQVFTFDTSVSDTKWGCKAIRKRGQQVWALLVAVRLSKKRSKQGNFYHQSLI